MHLGRGNMNGCVSGQEGVERRAWTEGVEREGCTPHAPPHTPKPVRATEAGGMHPTGMHSFSFFIFWFTSTHLYRRLSFCHIWGGHQMHHGIDHMVTGGEVTWSRG